MQKGQALIIGVNHVNPAGYGGKYDGRLTCPENDATCVLKLAKARGFACKKLFSEAATADAVLSHIRRTAESLESGDFFLMYYSGHGNRVVDAEGDEKDRGDETFCLYDRQMLDDELYALWPGFKPGVRILVIADSCHSGSATRNAVNSKLVEKAVDEQTNNRIKRKNRELRTKLRQKLPKEKRDITATVGLISGCMDHQKAYENTEAGFSEMTLALVRSLEKTDFPSYYALHESILNEIQNDEQTPQLSFLPDEKPAMAEETPLRP